MCVGVFCSIGGRDCLLTNGKVFACERQQRLNGEREREREREKKVSQRAALGEKKKSGRKQRLGGKGEPIEQKFQSVFCKCLHLRSQQVLGTFTYAKL